MHPTKTVYVVCYQATGSPEYKYRYEAGSIESAAQRLLVDGKPIRRRVLTIPQKDTYITIDAAETIESYSTKQKPLALSWPEPPRPIFWSGSSQVL